MATADTAQDQTYVSSWGRLLHYRQRVHPVMHRFAGLPTTAPMLAFGNGRSYGDVCLNEGGVLLTARGLDRFIAYDPDTGVIECEAGVLLSELIELTLPHGWFLPVTPGTCFVTLGGAIANDVHGKNHHRTGSFCNHVLEFELQRSDGQILRCTPTENRTWFSASAGGLGLTGLIRRVTLQLRRVSGPWIRGDSQRFGNLGEFFALARASDNDYEYTVAWLDCAASKSKLGRGVFMRGNHAPANLPTGRQRPLRMPVTPPFSLVNSLSLSLFNKLYFHRPAAKQADAVWHYQPFFYPLDGVLEWNRMYGPRGFFQYQCVVPEAVAEQSLTEMLERIGRSGMGSFLAVLKLFGVTPSLGMMSFPRAGATLALDFPNRGAATLALLESLDAITRAAGGAVYPAKDARMSADSFRQFFPNWREFSQYVDPQFSSSLWRRVMAHG
jgi:FAD/FMN-containing dehydrogenase